MNKIDKVISSLYDELDSIKAQRSIFVQNRENCLKHIADPTRTDKETLGKNLALACDRISKLDRKSFLLKSAIETIATASEITIFV